jgi:drug/metabolite transporter (DMT)-like permease
MEKDMVWYLFALLVSVYFLLMGFMPKTGVSYVDYNSFVSFSYALIISAAIIIHIIYKKIKEGD